MWPIRTSNSAIALMPAPRHTDDVDPPRAREIEGGGVVVKQHAPPPRRGRQAGPRHRGGRGRGRRRPSPRAGAGAPSSSETTSSSRCRIAILVAQHDGGTRAFERLRVARLVVARRARQRHEHGRNARRGQLGDGAGAGAAYGQRRARVQRFHVLFVRHEVVAEDVVGPVCGIERSPALVEVARPADVMHDHVVAPTPAVVAAERAPVDRARTLGTAEHCKQCGIMFWRPRHSRDACAHGIAGERCLRQRRAGQRHRGPRTEPNADAIGEAGRNVLLVHDQRNAPAPCRERRTANDA